MSGENDQTELAELAAAIRESGQRTQAGEPEPISAKARAETALAIQQATEATKAVLSLKESIEAQAQAIANLEKFAVTDGQRKNEQVTLICERIGGIFADEFEQIRGQISGIESAFKSLANAAKGSQEFCEANASTALELSYRRLCDRSSEFAMGEAVHQVAIDKGLQFYQTLKGA